MRVLLITHYALPHIGGIEVLVDDLSRQLTTLGYEVTVLTSRCGAPSHRSPSHVRMIRVAAWNVLERSLHVPYPVFSPTLLPILWREVRHADIVHVHGILYLGSLCAALAAWRWEKPLVVTEHVGFVPYSNPILNGLEKLALHLARRLFVRRADAILALNTAVQKWLAAASPYPEHFHFLPNGIDTDIFVTPTPTQRARARAELGLDPNRPLALFVGRFVEKKGLPTLLQARDESFDLLLCGSGQLPQDAEGRGVYVLRDVRRERMPCVYHAADVFVLPSRGEGFPIAIMEAMASGLPVVAVRDQTYEQYVTKDEILQCDASPDSVRTALSSLFGNDVERHRQSVAARLRAKTDFSLDACATRHSEVYETARKTRRLTTSLAAFGLDLASHLKTAVLRGLLGPAPPLPHADIGPGSGYTTHHVFPPGPVITVDISYGNLHALRERARGAGYDDRFLPVQADLHTLPFKKGSLGSILCTEVLEHTANDTGAARELIRVLRDDGRLVIEVPNAVRGYASFLEKLEVRTVHDVPGPEFHHRPGYTTRTLADLFVPFGGRVAQQQTFIRWFGQAMIDAIAAVHLAYERLVLKRSTWTWAEVEDAMGGPLFRIYRFLFPVVRLLARLDALLPNRTPGFTLAARIEKGDRD